MWHMAMLFTSNGSGITIGFNVTDNNRVYDNKIYSNRGSCTEIRRGSTNSKVNNNVCWQNGSDSVKDGGSESIITDTRVINPFPDTSVVPIVPPKIGGTQGK